MTTPEFRFWNDEDLQNLAPAEPLIEEVIPVGSLGVLYGPSGVGKSFVALGMAVAIALDLPWIGRPVRAGHVVYLAAEGAWGLAPRLAALKDSLGLDAVPNLTICPDPLYLHHGETLGAYLAQLQTNVPGPIALTVIDTLSRCSAGSDENSNADRELTVEGLNHIRRVTEGGVLAIHHTGWKEDRMRGGYALQAAADTILALKGSESGLELRVEKQRDGEDGKVISLCLRRSGGSLIVVDGQGQPGSLTEQQKKLLRILDDIATSEGVSTSVWLKSTGLPESSFYAARKKLLLDGYVSAVGRGKNALSLSGQELLQLQENSKELQSRGATTPLHSPPFRGLELEHSGWRNGQRPASIPAHLAKT